MSRKALTEFANQTYENMTRYFVRTCEGEDLSMGQTLADRSISVDTRDDNQGARFLPVKIEELMVESISDKYWLHRYNFYEEWKININGTRCCSDTVIAFHCRKTANRYLLEYLIYHAHPFGLSKNLTETLPTQLSKEEFVQAANTIKRPRKW